MDFPGINELSYQAGIKSNKQQLRRMTGDTKSTACTVSYADINLAFLSNFALAADVQYKWADTGKEYPFRPLIFFDIGLASPVKSSSS